MTILLHRSYINVPPYGNRTIEIEVIYDKTYTIKCTMLRPQGVDVFKLEKVIRDIPYIPTPMLEMMQLIHFHESDLNAEKMFEKLTTIFNSTLRQTIQKEYETSKIDAITITKDKLEIENKTLQHELQRLENENVKLKQNVEEQTHKLTYTHYELLLATASVARLEKELSTAQSIIKNLSQDLDDTTTELKIWESRCMQYEDEIYKLQEMNTQSLDAILENALDEL